MNKERVNDACGGEKRNTQRTETESTFELLQSREQTASACPLCADSLPYISQGPKTHLEINSSNVRPQSAHGEKKKGASQMDHTLYVNLVWTYSFSILEASLHMSLLSTFDFSLGSLLRIALNEQNLIYRCRATDDRLLALIRPQVFQHSLFTFTQRLMSKAHISSKLED